MKNYVLMERSIIFFLALFAINPLIFSQSFFQTYPQLTSSTINDIRETPTGFTLDISSFSFNAVDVEEFITDEQGNFIATQSFPGLSGLPYIRLSTGDFLNSDNDLTDGTVDYQLFDETGNLVNTFSIELPPIMDIFGGCGVSAEYANGEVLVTFHYGLFNGPGATETDLGLARVNPYTGIIIWQEEIDFNFTTGFGEVEIAEINSEGEAFLSVVNGGFKRSYLLKIASNGEELFNFESGSTSKYPKDISPSSDGEVFYIFNQVIITINKTGVNGFDMILEPIFMASVARDKVVATEDGGVMVAGRIGANMFVVRLDATGEVIQINVFDDLPEIREVTAGIRLSTGEYIFAGYIDPSSAFSDEYPFLIKVDENGAFIEDTMDGVDLELSLSANPANPQIWTNTSLSLTVTNHGNLPASDIEIEFKRPTNVVYTGGNEFSATKGNFMPWSDEIWVIPTLDAGESATLTVSYFMLTDDTRNVYAQVIALAETDIDSSPDNGNFPIANEDDEVLFVLNGGQTLFYPDLELADLQVPASGEVGTVVNITVDILNTGDATAVGDYVIGAYLTQFPNLGNPTLVGVINTGNTPIGTIEDVQGAITIPADFIPGNYYLVLDADINDAIFELAPFNNTTEFIPFEVTGEDPGCLLAVDLISTECWDDQNTADPADDTWRLDFVVTNGNLAGGYSIDGPGQGSVPNASGFFGQNESWFAPIDLGEITLTFTEQADPSCQTTLTVSPPAGCFEGPIAPCENLSITTSNGSLTLAGLSAPHVITKVFRPDWSTALDCLDNCNETETLTELNAGSYFIEVKLLDENWNVICELAETVMVESGRPNYHQDFQVYRNETSVRINWVNTNDELIDELEIERSSDGIHFEAIYQQMVNDAMVNTLCQQEDRSPELGLNFYRLKSYLSDGTTKYSDIKIIEIPKLANFEFYPNPANNFVNILLKDVVNPVLLQVMNLQGTIVKKIEIDADDSSNYHLDIQDLNNGQYLLWMKAEGRKAITKRLIIARY